MEVVYDNSVTTSNTINTGQGENISMVIHDAEDDASPSPKRSVVVSRSLHKSPKFKSLFNQLGFGVQARTAASEALMKISTEYGPQCYANEAAATRAFLESTNSITFTDKDMEVPYSDHHRPLYLEASINDVHVRRAPVETGLSVNVIPLAYLSLPRYRSDVLSSPRSKSPDSETRAKYAWASSNSSFE